MANKTKLCFEQMMLMLKKCQLLVSLQSDLSLIIRVWKKVWVDANAFKQFPRIAVRTDEVNIVDFAMLVRVYSLILSPNQEKKVQTIYDRCIQDPTCLPT